MVSRPDGEKIMKMTLRDKNLVIVGDLLGEIVSFFRGPFNGSDDANTPYYK